MLSITGLTVLAGVLLMKAAKTLYYCRLNEKIVQKVGLSVIALPVQSVIGGNVYGNKFAHFSLWRPYQGDHRCEHICINAHVNACHYGKHEFSGGLQRTGAGVTRGR